MRHSVKIVDAMTANQSLVDTEIEATHTHEKHKTQEICVPITSVKEKPTHLFFQRNMCGEARVGESWLQTLQAVLFLSLTPLKWQRVQSFSCGSRQ